MRKRSDWWVLVDDMILKYLHDEGTGTPKTVNEKIGKSQGYVNQRYSKLETYSLIQRLARGVYTITEEDEQYLEGELDTAQLKPNSRES